jgi:hypothetical protein
VDSHSEAWDAAFEVCQAKFEKLGIKEEQYRLRYAGFPVSQHQGC